MATRVTRDKVAGVIKSIHELVATRLLIGIPESDPGRRDGEPLSNAEIGYIQEMGSPVNNLPARPFLVPGVAAIQEKATGRLKQGAQAALAGDGQGVDRALTAAGLMAQSSVRATINAGIDPPLAASTLAARRRRGRTGTVPLIDTGQLRNAITFVLRKGK